MISIETCANCELEHDVEGDMQQALAHGLQLHFDFVNYCYENEPRMPGIFTELFDTPWDEDREVWFCGDECEQLYRCSGDFEYPECDSCGRAVCTQNPANGWHVQYRDHSEIGLVCLRCYQDEILKNGQPRSDYMGKSICGGMFFSYGNLEPKKAGFSEVPGFSDFFICFPESASRYNAKALRLIDSGHKVLTAYERMAIGGLEGYVTMMAMREKRVSPKPLNTFWK